MESYQPSLVRRFPLFYRYADQRNRDCISISAHLFCAVVVPIRVPAYIPGVIYLTNLQYIKIPLCARIPRFDRNKKSMAHKLQICILCSRSPFSLFFISFSFLGVYSCVCARRFVSAGHKTGVIFIIVSAI